VPGVEKLAVAAGIVVAFGAINMLGARTSVWVQTLMVVLFMTVLLVFSAVGMIRVDTDLMVPFVPNGYGPVLMAAVPAFFSYSGFGMIVEIGGEIKKPSWTIPWALAISFLMVWLCYTAVSVVIVGHIPWPDLAGNDAPVATVAGQLFPGWMTSVITLTILAAAATSINGILLGYSRDIFVMSKVRLMPEIFSTVSKSHGGPIYAVALLTVTSLIAVLFGAKVSQYATVIVLAIMVAQILQGIAMLRLPRIMPERLQGAEFRLGRFWLLFFTLGLMLSSVFFLYIGVQGSLDSVAVLAAILLAGVIYYLARRAVLASRSVDLASGVSRHIEDSIAELGDPGHPPRKL
jgi:amino acid transporter